MRTSRRMVSYAAHMEAVKNALANGRREGLEQENKQAQLALDRRVAESRMRLTDAYAELFVAVAHSMHALVNKEKGALSPGS